jgi:hypothetical protein
MKMCLENAQWLDNFTGRQQSRRGRDDDGSGFGNVWCSLDFGFGFGGNFAIWLCHSCQL